MRGRTESPRIAAPTEHSGHGQGRSGIWAAWTLATAAGELLGFAVPALAGALAFWLLGEPDTGAGALTLAATVLVAGIGEGAILGAFQWRVLRRALPAISRRAWVGATAAGAAAAWALGLLPSTLDALIGLPTRIQIAAWTALALPLLCTIGVAQAMVLRQHVHGVRRWVAANALAWLLGLPVTFIGPALVPDGSPPAVWVTVFIASGLAMGMIVGAITGLALIRLLPPAGATGPCQAPRCPEPS